MSESKLFVGLQDKQYFWLKLEGDVRVPWCVSLETYCEQVIQQPGVLGVYVDLSEAENLDSTTLGVLAKVAIHTRKYCDDKAVLLCSDENILRLILSMGFAKVFDIRGSESANYPSLDNIVFDELPVVECTEADMKDSVIAAHRTLMDMTEDNRASFSGLVNALEADRETH